jgi:hypothetical protein
MHMANEGSTKPTWVCVCGLLVSDYSKRAHVLCDVVAKRVRRESESELARVRGLLQRALNKIANAGHDLLALEGECPKAVLIALELTEVLVPEGAESADIGKLDRVDGGENG